MDMTPRKIEIERMIFEIISNDETRALLLKRLGNYYWDSQQYGASKVIDGLAQLLTKGKTNG